MEIDADALPMRPLLDTSFFIRAIGGFPEDPRSALCVSLFEALQEKYLQRLLVAAPTIAEILRHTETPQPVPRVQGLEVVDFDEEAAEFLGQKFPMRVLRTIKDATGASMTYLKYDALIIACAKTHGAGGIICLDDPMARLAAEVEIRTWRPRDFLKRPPPPPAQQSLFDGLTGKNPGPSPTARSEEQED